MLPLLIHCRTRVLEFEMWTVFSMILVQMSVYLLACWRLWKVAYDKFLNGRAPPLLPESKSPTNISYIKCGVSEYLDKKKIRKLSIFNDSDSLLLRAVV